MKTYYDTECGWSYTESFFREAYEHDVDDKDSYPFEKFVQDILTDCPSIVEAEEVQ